MLTSYPKAFHVLSFLQASPPKNVRIYLPHRNCRMPIPPHCPLHYHSNNILRGNNSLSEACVRFRNVLTFYAKIPLSYCPNPNFEDHPLSAVHNCLISTFTPTFHISKPSPSCSTWWSLYILVLTHLTWNLVYIVVNSSVFIFAVILFLSLSIHVHWNKIMCMADKYKCIQSGVS